jgi:hypothetical protein
MFNHSANRSCSRARAASRGPTRESRLRLDSRGREFRDPVYGGGRAARAKPARHPWNRVRLSAIGLGAKVDCACTRHGHDDGADDHGSTGRDVLLRQASLVEILALRPRGPAAGAAAGVRGVRRRRRAGDAALRSLRRRRRRRLPVVHAERPWWPRAPARGMATAASARGRGSDARCSSSPTGRSSPRPASAASGATRASSRLGSTSGWLGRGVGRLRRPRVGPHRVMVRR